MPDREKGVQSVACPTCGNELAVSDQLDGGVAAETCASCYPSQPDEQQAEPQAETASAAPAPRERGTRVSKENADG